MRSTRSIDVQGVDHFALSVKVVTQYQRGVLFRLGKVVVVKEPGLALIMPVIDRLAGVAADCDDADPVTGNHHPRQRQRRHLRSRLLPRRRPAEIGDRPSRNVDVMIN